MFEFSDLLLFMIATISLNLTPGPDILYITSRAMSHGKKAGVVSALGIGGGIFVHILLAVLGISAILKVSAVAFVTLKVVGAVYLIYLGFTNLKTDFSFSDSGELSQLNLKKFFYQGVLTNALNPKVAIFFITFLPQFIDPAKGSVPLQILILGLLFNLSGTTVSILVGVFSGSLSEKLRKNIFWQKILKWFSSSVLFLLGIRLAFVSQE